MLKTLVFKFLYLGELKTLVFSIFMSGELWEDVPLFGLRGGPIVPPKLKKIKNSQRFKHIFLLKPLTQRIKILKILVFKHFQVKTVCSTLGIR